MKTGGRLLPPKESFMCSSLCQIHDHSQTSTTLPVSLEQCIKWKGVA